MTIDQWLTASHEAATEKWLEIVGGDGLRPTEAPGYLSPPTPESPIAFSGMARAKGR